MPGRPTSRRSAPVDPVMVGRARDLLARAHLLLDNADGGVSDDAERFRQFYLVALRAAGAALAIGEPVGPSRRKTSNAWTRIGVVAPELAPLAARFASLSSVRMKIESGGIIRTLDPDSVAGMRLLVLDFLRQVETLVIAYEQGKFGTEEPQIGRTA